MVGDYMLYIILDKIEKIIDIKKIDDTKTLIDADDKLLNDITLKCCNFNNMCYKRLL